MKINAKNKELHIQKLFEEYLLECQYVKYLRPKTMRGYREVFLLFSKLVPEVTTIHDLNPIMVSEFFKRLVKKRLAQSQEPLRQSTIRTYYNKLITFFRWLENTGHFENGDLTKHITKPSAPQYDDSRALNELEVSRILTSITKNGKDHDFVLQRDLVIVHILLYTGIRKGELLNLRIHDIDFVTKKIFINGQTSKSKKSRRIPIHPTLNMHLRAYLQILDEQKYQCPYLIVSTVRDEKLKEGGIESWVKKYRKLSGVPLFIHRFRHTFACTLAKQNADIVSIKSVMGHSSIRMTERYLRSINSENARSFINKISY